MLPAVLLLVGCAGGTGDTIEGNATQPSATTAAGDSVSGSLATNCDEAADEVVATSGADDFTPDVAQIDDGGAALDDDGEPWVDDTVYTRYAEGTLAFEELPQPVSRLGSGDAPRFVVYCTGSGSGQWPDGTAFSQESILYGVTAGADGTLLLLYSVLPATEPS